VLLQEYRQQYRERYPVDYRKLFPEGEPEWERPIPSESETQDEVRNLLAPLERALRDRQQAVDRLTEENQQLRAEWVALQVARQKESEAPPGTPPPGRAIADEELQNDCAELLENQKYYINAIRSAGLVLEVRLRKTIGGDGPEKFKEGVKLVDYALQKDSGRLIISEHPAEQEGVHMLFRGATQFVRNPPSHKKLQYTELEARQAVGLIDYLLSLLRQAKPRE
jgi:uncharacterized protein (TIGR02391 family)